MFHGENIHICAPDVFLPCILNESSIYKIVFMCQVKMYIYAPECSLYMTWFNEWKKHEEQETNELSMKTRTMKSGLLNETYMI